MKNFKKILAAIALSIVAAMALLSSALVQAQEVRTYYITDAVGSPVKATDAYGNVTWSEDYLPYGERRTRDLSSGNNERWFTGAPQNEDTGLVDLGNRQYDPVIGRFLSVDPVGASSEKPFSVNRYAYANNSPYNNLDPDGRDCVSANQRTTCTPMKDGVRVNGLPVISFPAPQNWPEKMSKNDQPFTHHEYLYSDSIGGKNAESVRLSIVNDPTPNDSDSPATQGGTSNDASPSSGFRGFAARRANNDVISYSGVDSNGVTWELNVTKPTHSLSPGYVLRGVVNGKIVSYGEGVGKLQMFGGISNIAINNVWVEQNKKNVENAQK